MNSDKFDLEAILKEWESDPHIQEVLAKLGSDYDENGVPYWEK
jgi:hypothetical protein